MARRRILYFAALISAVVFFWAYREWLGWLVLLTVLCLPIMSLLLSLPSLFCMKVRLEAPGVVERGSTVYVHESNHSWFPTPAYDCVITVYKPLTKKSCSIQGNEPLPTMHCGTLRCSIGKIVMTDYLGLFRFRLGSTAIAEVTVRPKNTTASQLLQLQQQVTTAWKPKPGGGFAENHEMRLYRPGDNLNQIHWKLSAKTKKLVIREPMIPFGQKAAVGLCLFGTDEQLDAKFSRLMGVSNYLLDTGIPFELHAISAQGAVRFPIASAEELTEAVDELLGMEPASEEQGPATRSASVYWIGGNADEN